MLHKFCTKSKNCEGPTYSNLPSHPCFMKKNFHHVHFTYLNHTLLPVSKNNNTFKDKSKHSFNSPGQTAGERCPIKSKKSKKIHTVTSLFPQRVQRMDWPAFSCVIYSTVTTIIGVKKLKYKVRGDGEGHKGGNSWLMCKAKDRGKVEMRGVD